MTEYTTTNIDGINIRHPVDLPHYIDKIREKAKRLDEEGVGVNRALELNAAFDIVADPTDWRKPIDAWIELADLELVKEAVEYFTATTLRFDDDANIPRFHGTKVRMIAVGYRDGPAGP